MRINWISYYLQYNGFGKASSRMVDAMQRMGIEVSHMTVADLEKPEWMLRQQGVDLDYLKISFLDVHALAVIKNNHWLFTMCESSLVGKSIIKKIHKTGAERLIVPSEFCKRAFEDSGIKIPVSVVLLGTDPLEYYYLEKVYPNDRPYTFLTIADRGDRKGWMETFDAFYKAFGGKTTGVKDVRLIIKCLPGGNAFAKKISTAEDLDPRIKFDISHYDNMADFYKQGDCLCLPSRSEGWGMPHREAAMMGLPVIMQKTSGLDDGHADGWAWIIPPGRMELMPDSYGMGRSGSWEIPSINRIAEAMLLCYEEPDVMADEGRKARNYLSNNQTWEDAARNLFLLISEQGYYSGIQMDSSTFSVSAEASRALYTNDIGIRQKSSFPTS